MGIMQVVRVLVLNTGLDGAHWHVWGCDGTVLRQVGKVPQGAADKLIPRPQKMANNLQRQGRSARLVERWSYCTEKLLAGGKFADAR